MSAAFRLDASRLDGLKRAQADATAILTDVSRKASEATRVSIEAHDAVTKHRRLATSGSAAFRDQHAQEVVKLEKIAADALAKAEACQADVQAARDAECAAAKLLRACEAALRGNAR